MPTISVRIRCPRLLFPSESESDVRAYYFRLNLISAPTISVRIRRLLLQSLPHAVVRIPTASSRMGGGGGGDEQVKQRSSRASWTSKRSRRARERWTRRRLQALRATASKLCEQALRATVLPWPFFFRASRAKITRPGSKHPL